MTNSQNQDYSQKKSFSCSRIKPLDIAAGRLLRQLRRQNRLSQHQLGKQIGVSFQQIQKYECGANRICLGRLYDLCKELNVCPTVFIEKLGELI